jgi:hypothetical protein
MGSDVQLVGGGIRLCREIRENDQLHTHAIVQTSAPALFTSLHFGFRRVNRSICVPDSVPLAALGSTMLIAPWFRRVHPTIPELTLTLLKAKSKG